MADKSIQDAADKLISKAGAARRTGIPDSTIDAAVSNGQIQTAKAVCGAKWLVLSSVKAWARKHKERANKRKAKA